MEVPAYAQRRNLAAFDPQVLRGEKILVQKKRRCDDLADIHQFARARPVRDQVEKIVHEIRGAERLLLHLLQQLVFRVVWFSFSEQQLGIGGDAGERCVDLMSDAGSEESE